MKSLSFAKIPKGRVQLFLSGTIVCSSALFILLLGIFYPARQSPSQNVDPSISAEPSDALWVAFGKEILKVGAGDASVLLRISQLKNVRRIAVDDAHGVLWAVAVENDRESEDDKGRPETLHAFSLTGEELLTVALQSRKERQQPHNWHSETHEDNQKGIFRNLFDWYHGDGGDGDEKHRGDRQRGEKLDDRGPVSLVVNAADGMLWLASGRVLRRFTIEFNGQEIRVAGTLVIGQSRDIRSLALDPVDSRIWVATDQDVGAYDPAIGEKLLALDLGRKPRVADIDVDSTSGYLWVALKKGLRRYNADGHLLGNSGIKGIGHLAGDGAGGIWATTAKRLLRIAPSGEVLLEIDPLAEKKRKGSHGRGGDHHGDDDEVKGAIVALAANAADSSVWLATQDRLRHIGAKGDRLESLEFNEKHRGRKVADAIRDLALSQDLTPPLIAFSTPVEGAILDTKTPAIEVTFSDDGVGVDPSTLTFETNGGMIAASCVFNDGSSALCTPSNPFPEGLVSVGATVRDFAGNMSERATRNIVVDTAAPIIAILTPQDASVLNNNSPVIQVSYSDVGSGVDLGTLLVQADNIGVTCSAGPAGASCVLGSSLPEGTVTVIASIKDQAGNSAVPAQANFTVDTVAPSIAIASPADNAVVNSGTPTIEVDFDDNGSGVDPSTLDVLANGVPLNCTPDTTSAACTPAAGLPDGPVTVNATIQDRAGNLSAPAQVGFTIDTGGSGLPPDPSAVASAIDPTVPTAVGDSTAFLYSNANPIQTGVDPATIDPKRAAVLRGKVLTRDGAPLSGVAVTVLDHAEFGGTLSRSDGMFDMAVNGGSLLTVSYTKDGFLPAQRKINVPWQNYVGLPDIIMTPLDPQVTTIDLTQPSMQVARGSVVSDSDGTRQSTLLFPAGTQASLQFPPNNFPQSISTVNVRATEYTVGPNGPAAMPALLPPTSAYTYAVEFSVDEAIAAGATGVTFSPPLVHYVENFLGFRVGGAVPSGFYNPQSGHWEPSGNGTVIGIVGITAGLADVDIDGDGIADDAASLTSLGITDDERMTLAGLYNPGQSLWRVSLSHLSTLDINWPNGLPPDSKYPDEPDPNTNPPDDKTCKQDGSIIECQNQTLGERLAIVGTPYTLNYRSDRVPGRASGYTVDIPLSGNTIPPSLKRIELELHIAGQTFQQSFPAQANLTYPFAWDGKDAFGRTPQGKQAFYGKIGYVYDGFYYDVPADRNRSFARVSSVSTFGVTARREFILYQYFQSEGARLGGIDARGEGLGGWTLDAHHLYDPQGRVLYLGDGNRRSTYGIVPHSIQTIAQLNNPRSVVSLPDGSIYVVSERRIHRVSPDGTATPIAGTGIASPTLDGVDLNTNMDPAGLAPGPGGSYEVQNPTGPGTFQTVTVFRPLLYFADTENNRVRLLRDVGTFLQVETIAGSGVRGYETNFPPGIPGFGTADELPATQGRLDRPTDVAPGPDGTLYIADAGNHRVRSVTPDTFIHTAAGTGVAGFSGDGGLAPLAQLNNPTAVAVGPDGTVYIADTGNQRIRRIAPDGTITTVAGTGVAGFSGDGGPAVSAQLNNPSDVVIGADGSLYITDTNNHRVRRILSDGTIITVAGTGTSGFSGEGGRPAAAQLAGPSGIAMSPNGALLIADNGNHRVRQIALQFPGFTAQDFAIPSEDGGQLYRFDANGRHLNTVNTLTGAVLHSFGYNAAGLLISITDGDGNVTTIERNGAGEPTAIAGPYGQRTTLSLDGNGYLASVTNPANETHSFTYHGSGGLLATYTDPRGNTTQITYDALGRLSREEDPAGGFVALTRTVTNTGYEVTETTAEGRATTYTLENLPTGGQRSLVTYATGGQTEVVLNTDGSQEITYPDGTTVDMRHGPDPRFGMQAPFVQSLSVTTPGNIINNMTATRTATLTDPANLLSLDTLVQSVTANGRSFTYTYDAATRVYTAITPEGNQTITTGDALGRPTRIELASGVDPITMNYDARGRLAQVIQGAQSWTYVYDQQGRVASRTDGAGKEMLYTYDGANRLASVTPPSSDVEAYVYDPNGNRTQLIMPSGAVHFMGYTTRDLLASYTSPNNTSSLRAYNLDRQLASRTLAGGRVLTNSFDASGRWNGVAYDEATVAFSYAGPTDLLATLPRTPTGGGTAQQVSYQYDGGLFTAAMSTGTASGGYSYTYDNNFWLTSMDLVSGTDNIQRSLTWNNDGQLTSNGPFTFVRGGPGGTLSQVHDGALIMDIGYDSLARVDSRTYAVNGQAVYSFDLTRDNTGLITTKSETLGGVNHTFEYTYDADGQLTEVKRDGSTVETYTYDVNGNRLTTLTTAATYDIQDRLVQQGSVDYQFNADGFLEQRGSDTFEYSSRGELTRVALGAGGDVIYDYDGLGRRVSRTDASGTNQYLYGNPGRPHLPTAARDPNGILTVFFYDEEGLLFAFERGGDRYYVATDQVGSPRVVTDSAGNVVKVTEFDSFGGLLSDSAPGFDLPLGFAGGLDGSTTGLVRFGYRDYEPASGRWTARDPILYDGGQANLYSYLANDPINLRDPLGLWCVGGSIYAVIGGGGEVCCSDGQCSVCAEAGVGAGAGLSLGSGKAKDTGHSLAAELGANCFGLVGAGLKCSYNHKCGGDCDIAGNVGPFGFDTSKEYGTGLDWSPQAKCSAQGKVAVQGCGKF